jgi:hypothetical protein
MAESASATTRPPAAKRDGAQFRTIRDAVWECGHIGGSAKLVALRLVEHWPRIFPSLRTIATYTGLSERTVRDALRELERSAVIKTTKHKGLTSTYAFVGVSIPAFGSDTSGEPPRQISPEGEPDAEPDPEPRQILPDPPAESAGPPRQILPPKRIMEAVKLSGGSRRASGAPPPPSGLWTNLDGWEMSKALRREALAAGVPARCIDDRISRLRNTRIGGRWGVRDRDDYVRGWFPKWAEWDGGKGGKARRFEWEPDAKMQSYAKAKKLPLENLAEQFVETGAIERCANVAEANDAFVRILIREAKKLKTA